MAGRPDRAPVFTRVKHRLPSLAAANGFVNLRLAEHPFHTRDKLGNLGHWVSNWLPHTHIHLVYPPISVYPLPLKSV
jgi:hypothetical protein